MFKPENIIFLLFFLLHGCSTVHFTHKNDTSLNTKDIFASSANIGLAALGVTEAIKEIHQPIEKQAEKFAGHKLNFEDISEELKVNEDRSRIENASLIFEKYPAAKYAIVVWAFPPKQERKYYVGTEDNNSNKYSHREWDNKSKNFISIEEKYEKKEMYHFYISKLSVKCEVMLFDLKSNTLLAKAEDEFLARAEYKEPADSLKGIPILNFFEALFNIAESYSPSQNKFPILETLPPESFKNYFYQYFSKLTE